MAFECGATRLARTIASRIGSNGRSRGGPSASVRRMSLQKSTPLSGTELGSGRRLRGPSLARFSTTSALASPPKPPPPRARPRSPPPATSPIVLPPIDDTPDPNLKMTPELKTKPVPIRLIRPLTPEELIPPHPYDPIAHDSLRSISLTGNASRQEQDELARLDEIVSDWSVAVHEAEDCRAFGFAPINATTPAGSLLLKFLYNMKGELKEKDVWGGFLVPSTRTLATKKQGRVAAFDLTPVSDSTRWRVWPYVVVAGLGTAFHFGLAAQLTELSNPKPFDGTFMSAMKTPWNFWAETSSLVMTVSLVVWYTAGVSKRTTPSRWNMHNSRAVVFSPSKTAVVSGFDRFLARGDRARLLHERLEFLPLRQSAFRMWTSNFVHHDTSLLMRNIFHFWLAGALAFGCFFVRDADQDVEGVVAYARRMLIGSAEAPPVSEGDASAARDSAATVASSRPQNGIHHFVVFAATAGVFGSLCSQIHMSYVRLPKAAKALRLMLLNPATVAKRNPPWFAYQPKLGPPRAILGERLVNELNLAAPEPGLSNVVFSLSTLALLASPDKWILGSVPAVVPAVMICGPLLAKDLASIGRDWNTPRRHYGHLPAILFGVVYFIFGSAVFEYFVAHSASRDIYIPAPGAEPEPEPESVVEEAIDPNLQVFTFQGKTYRLPPRIVPAAPPS